VANRFIICGGNGAGKSTLGKALSLYLGWEYRDIEDYYFPKKDSDYVYETPRTREAVQALLMEDLERYENFILSAVKGNYGMQVTSLFTCAVRICVPKAIRMQRVFERSYQKFGDRILVGGDLYEQEKRFFDMVAKRSDEEITQWLDTIEIPIIQVDGTKPTEENVLKIWQSYCEICKS